MTFGRHEINSINNIEVTFVNKFGYGITNAMGVVLIRRQSDDNYYNGATWALAPTEIPMTEVSEINSPGLWRYPFTPTANDIYCVSIIDTNNNANVVRFEGEIVVDEFLPRSLLNALIASYSAAGSVGEEIQSHATEANATANVLATNLNIDGNEAKIDTIDNIVDGIKLKTDNLPVDPASEATASSNKASIQSDIAGLPTTNQIVDGVLDEALIGHVGVGSVGESIGRVDAPISSRATPADVTGAVSPLALEATLLANKTVTDSNAAALSALATDMALALGLSHQNYRMKSVVYDGNGLLQTATIGIYPTAVDTSADTNALATYSVTAVYDAGLNLVDYQMVKNP